MTANELLRAGVLLDPEDIHFLIDDQWYIGSHDGYVQRTCAPGFTEYLHNRVIGRLVGKVVDHINRNRLDNRKQNLRHVEHATNCMNRDNCNGRAVHKHILKGIRQNRSSGRFVVRVSQKGKSIHVGTYKTLNEAQAAYENFITNTTKA